MEETEFPSSTHPLSCISDEEKETRACVDPNLTGFSFRAVCLHKMWKIDSQRLLLCPLCKKVFPVQREVVKAYFQLAQNQWGK